jgi:hypothetical protein
MIPCDLASADGVMLEILGWPWGGYGGFTSQKW